MQSPKSQPDTPQRANWTGLSLRAKVCTIVTIAAAGGFALGFVSRVVTMEAWAPPAALTLMVIAICTLIGRSIWNPYLKLLAAIRIAERDGQLVHASELPIDRRDEVGRIARAFQRIRVRAQRHNREAHLIRRTLDDRIETETEKAIRELKRMAMRDALTDLGNRHFLEQTLESVFKSIKAADDDLVCLVIDVDNFKQLNDTLGHSAGDELLILLADLIRGIIRREDFAVRLGGDEFVILLPSCGLVRARSLAQQLGDLFRQHTRTTLPAHVPVSLSIGISSAKQDRAQDGDDLMQIADRKLYAAKRAGKAQSVGA